VAHYLFFSFKYLHNLVADLSAPQIHISELPYSELYKFI